MKNFLTNIKLQGAILLIIFSISASIFILTTNEMIILWSGILFGGCIYYGLFNNKDKQIENILYVVNKLNNVNKHNEEIMKLNNLINIERHNYNTLFKIYNEQYTLYVKADLCKTDIQIKYNELSSKHNDLISKYNLIISKMNNNTRKSIEIIDNYSITPTENNIKTSKMSAIITNMTKNNEMFIVNNIKDLEELKNNINKIKDPEDGC